MCQSKLHSSTKIFLQTFVNLMFLLTYISLFLLLCSCITGVSGTCSESELSCSIGSIISSCTIRAENATRTSYLINQCSLELVQIGVTNARFSVYLQENGGTVTLDIATNITEFRLYISGINFVDFINTQTQIEILYLQGFEIIYCPYDLLNHFPSVTYLEMHFVAFDGFPYFNHTSLTQLNMYYLTLPYRVTTQPSMLILPSLISLQMAQLEDAQWFHLIPSSFDNVIKLEILHLTGLHKLYSYQFANLPSLTQLYLYNFFTIFTFELNALAGLDGLAKLFIYKLETNINFVTKETFPSLKQLDLRNTLINTLDQSFFERQKQIETVYAH